MWWVDLIILILSFIIMFVGILGSVLPILPGPLTSWLGLIILHFHSSINGHYFILIVTFLIAIAIFILDYLIPIFTSQKLGASKYGVWGAVIGTIIGIFFSLPGLILGPIIGAIVGEAISKKGFKDTLKSAFGVILGLLVSGFAKAIASIGYLFICLIIVMSLLF